MNMNFTRQEELYDAENSNDSVTVIGCGATGSWVCLQLAKLGVKYLSMIDMDKIEIHNIPNQIYSIDSAEEYKVGEMLKLCKMLGSGVTNYVYSLEELTSENFDSAYIGETVFCLVDSMKARKELFNAALKNNICKVWIETRMGLTGYRIYVVHMNNQNEIDKYKETLYSDDESEVSACGASQSIVSTAMQCASHAVGLWLSDKNEKDNEIKQVPNELIYDVSCSFLMTRKFDTPKE